MTWKVAGSPIVATRAPLRGWRRGGAQADLDWRQGTLAAPKRQPSATGNAGVAGIDAAAAKPDMAGVRRAADRTAALGVFERSRLLRASMGRAGLVQRPRKEIR